MPCKIASKRPQKKQKIQEKATHDTIDPQAYVSYCWQ